MELTLKQQFRKNWILESIAGKCTNREASVVLNLCVGHVKTIKRRFKKFGDRVFIHGNTGRKPPHTISKEEINKIIEIKELINQSGQKIFSDVNFSHFTEILERDYGIKHCKNTISNILKKAGYESPKKRKRRRKQIHASRPPKRRMGELLQGDGTPFDWLGNGHKYCLHALIDDSTKTPTGMYFTKNECSFGYYECLRQTVLNYGIPESLYVDRLSIFFSDNKKQTIEEQLSGKKSITQFNQSLDKLGIELIPANSPQAKGRVERFWQTAQSRLPVELKIRNIQTIEEANNFLPHFMRLFSKNFATEPIDKISAFVPLTEEQKLDLAKILSVKIERKTNNGCILSLKNYLFKVAGVMNQKVTIYLSVQDGIYGITASGKKVELELYDEDSSGNVMPEVWKDLIEEYFFKDAKHKYRLPYTDVG